MLAENWFISDRQTNDLDSTDPVKQTVNQAFVFWRSPRG